MNFADLPKQETDASLALAHQHYENFPVASLFLPKRLRGPIAIIYRFARQADDFADEGQFTIDERLSNLKSFKDELDLIQAYINPTNEFFKLLALTIKTHQLPISPFYDLLDAFSQDVVKTRYQDFDEVLNYCKRSANPVGTLLLHLYKEATPKNLALSNKICSALQLINFYQDIAIDYAKNDGKSRIYLCQTELLNAGIYEQDIANKQVSNKWEAFMLFNIQRAESMLLAGKPLGKILKGRIGFELRMIVAGGEQIIKKLKRCKGDIYHHRPQLNALDWVMIFIKALFKR
jgi:squalene synthase HpnC